MLYDEASAHHEGAWKADVVEASERVRFPDADMILELVGYAPSSFTMHARNPAHNLQPGGDAAQTSCPGQPAPNCSDVDGGRRPGNQADFRTVKLAQMHNVIHCTGGYPVELDRHSPPRSVISNASATLPLPDRQGLPRLFAWQGNATWTGSRSRASSAA
ncbi:MAG: trimethylamine methyltransferase family protein [Rhizobiaceae bacterium]|nr:trimethylamine methyltransferase family protein [Rhizobiaceae bacterium]